MTLMKFALGAIAYAMSGWALAGTAPVLGTQLGSPLGVLLSNATNLPLVEGGMLSVAVVGLIAGIRMIQRKKKQKD